MAALIIILKFWGGLILLFALGNLMGHYLKYDKLDKHLKC